MSKQLTDLYLAGLLICLLVPGFATSAVAAPMLYNIESSNPALSSSFSYDASNPQPFSNFEVSAIISGQSWSLAQDLWQHDQVGSDPGQANYTVTLNFDLTNWANKLTSNAICDGDWCISTPADAFSLLMTNPISWTADYWGVAGSTDHCDLTFSSNQGFVWFDVSSDPENKFNLVSDKALGDAINSNQIAGTFYVPTSPIPEPSTYVLLLAGLGLIGFSSRRCSILKATKIYGLSL